MAGMGTYSRYLGLKKPNEHLQSDSEIAVLR
jgi:hypothetical protein